MTNQLPPQLYIFAALDCEAKPLVNFFDLKKQNSHHCFSIYRNKQIILTVAGVGKIAMAGAVAYTLAVFPCDLSPVLVNVGIAGHKTLELGTLCIAIKIVDDDSGKKFYPQLIGHNWPEICEIKTTSLPCIQYEGNYLNDMEASAFYETAVRFSSSELVHCIKVVSDNETSSILKIDPKSVTDWIANQTKVILHVIQQLEKLREIIEPGELDEYYELIDKFHFTVSGKIKLKTLLMRWKVLSDDVWQYSYDVGKSGKNVLKKLETDIDNLDVFL